MERNGKQNETVFPENLNIAWCQTIIRQLQAFGADRFVISPGMRNAPLIKAIQNIRDIEYFLNIDERSASYQALGMAKGSGHPVVLVCTSGTALGNYYPAIVEAYYSQLPLIILSADRPIELAHFDVNQTIDQERFFGKFATFVGLPLPSLQVAPDIVLNNIAKNLAPNGITHINVPLKEPLGSQKEVVDQLYQDRWRKTKPVTYKPGYRASFECSYLPLEKTLLVIGALPFCQEKESIRKLSDNFPGDIYLDVTSSIKFGSSRNDQITNNYEQIIHLGGRVTDKDFYTKFLNIDKTNLIVVNENHHKKDYLPKISQKLQISPELFASWLLENNSSKEKENANETNITVTDDFELLAQTVVEIVPERSNLYIGNSLAIRAFDSIASTTKILHAACNRAVSGIEGLIASASGLAIATNQETTLVLGDLSFIHDCNSLALVRELPLTIIVVNNGGGKIFETLPVSNDHKLLAAITTPHNYRFENLAKQFDLSYQLINNVASLKEAYGKYKIIEVNLNGTVEKGN